MRLTALKIRVRSMSVDIETTSHNSLRWAVQAIDLNEKLAKSLLEYSKNGTVLLTDSIYLLTNDFDVEKIPLNTHIIFWDGINSYVELLERQSATANRADLKFYVVGWLDGAFVERDIHIESLYPASIPNEALSWKNILNYENDYFAPYWYRTLTSILTHARYFKNWAYDTKKHQILAEGGNIVFCGLVTPTKHNIDTFFRGVNFPALRFVCEDLTNLQYTSEEALIDETLESIIGALGQEVFLTPSSLACVYSLLNVMHRVKTLSLLHKSTGTLLFVNEARNSSRFDPYDSFRYSGNLYLDFGSTRGPDAVYPRTVDLGMTDKRSISIRYLGFQQTISQYLENLSYLEFSGLAQEHAQLVRDAHSAHCQ